MVEDFHDLGDWVGGVDALLVRFVEGGDHGLECVHHLDELCVNVFGHVIHPLSFSVCWLLLLGDTAEEFVHVVLQAAQQGVEFVLLGLDEFEVVFEFSLLFVGLIHFQSEGVDVLPVREELHVPFSDRDGHLAECLCVIVEFCIPQIDDLFECLVLDPRRRVGSESACARCACWRQCAGGHRRGCGACGACCSWCTCCAR